MGVAAKTFETFNEDALPIHLPRLVATISRGERLRAKRSSIA
jgi:hypothetical protein